MVSRRLMLALSAMALTLRAASGAEPAEFFEKNVRPIFAARCYTCHGAAGTPKGGLRLDSVAGIRKGGDGGPVIVPGKPDQSMLVRAIQHGEQIKMPPKSKLPPPEIATLTAWVKMGAPMPDAKIDSTKVELPSTGPIKSDHWAFQPMREPAVPKLSIINYQLSNPIDAFHLSALAAKGLRPAAPADKRTLIRRVTFDLTGLPPTPGEIDAFLKDDSPHSFARVVERLLASPAYGERWGRHWLDVARYADSNGMDENLVQAHAWRYRDYVITAFNSDKPYDQFVKEQLAGDLLPAADERITHERQIATGFLALGPKMLAEDDPVKMQMDIVDEQIDTAGKAFLGLTLGCARCHDHKFDPIPTADYYSLAGIFKSTKVMDNYKVVAKWHERTIASKAELARRQTFDADFDKVKAKLTERVGADARRQLPGVVALFGLPPIARFGVLPVIKKQHEQLDAQRKPLADQVAALEKQRPILPEAMGAAEGTAGNVRIHLRGNHITLGAEVPRRFPRVLAGERQPPIDTKQSGRLELANWLTRPDHPLTARVLVNRVWHWHFGAGLVRSTDNFGRLGERPSHPELLDWLARRFVEDGWSIKALHRRIVLSNLYQTSTAWNEQAAEVDPDNRLLWRFPRQRLDAESLRDALLAVGGKLDRTLGGSLLQGNNRGYVPGYPNGIYEKYDFPRRSVYLPVVRSMLYDVFQAFDFADPSSASGERASTTVAPQALFMLNGKLMHEQAREFARLLLADPALDDATRVRHAYERAYARLPTSAETTRALAFLRRVDTELAAQKRPEPERRLSAWQSLCRVLLSANEFVFVE